MARKSPVDGDHASRLGLQAAGLYSRPKWTAAVSFTVTPYFARRNGLVVAVTDVEILVKTTQAPDRDIRLTSGQTYWIDAATTSAVRLGAECEFVYVEARQTISP